MKLFTQSILDQLAANGRINHERMLNGQDAIDHKPVVKLFTPDAGATLDLSRLSSAPCAHLCNLPFESQGAFVAQC